MTTDQQVAPSTKTGWPALALSAMSTLLGLSTLFWSMPLLTLYGLEPTPTIVFSLCTALVAREAIWTAVRLSARPFGVSLPASI